MKALSMGAPQVHPCGDYVLSGTTHPRVRLHDLETLQCFATMQVGHEHTNSVQDVRRAAFWRHELLRKQLDAMKVRNSKT